MANNIGHISGYGNYGVGGYVPQRKGGEELKPDTQAQAQPQQNNNQNLLDPEKVTEFIANMANNFYVAPAKAPVPVEGVETDPGVADRAEFFMQNYEMVCDVIAKEFGEEYVPQIADAFFSRVFGMVD